MANDFDQDDKTHTHHVLTGGMMVSHYRIVEKIGAGGMGEVYLAEDTELNRNVALKFLPTHLSHDQDYRTRFKREAQAAAKLNHPNILTIYEVGEHQHRPFFSMEWVEGKPLNDFIQDGALSLDTAIDTAFQLCEGLSKAHREGIIHRDIKPSNIIIDNEGRARLVDFGLATIQHDEKITRPGSTMGTIGYMSPEQVKGKSSDQRSDLFSLGVVFYEMITGRRPFKKDNEAATLNAIINDKPKPIAQYNPDVPNDLQRIVLKMMEKDPAYRYQEAGHVISDLKKLLASEKIEIRKPVDWWNRYIVVGAVLTLLVITGYWLLAEFGIVSSNQQASEQIMLAVLPFENLGLPEDEYFADGITDEITSRLAMVHSIGVISRTSAYAYKHSQKTLPEIARELGVNFVLEGTIRWDKSGDTNKVRITPQLIRVPEDVHLWAHNYEQALTQVFELQAEIAAKIVDALGLTLLAAERQSITYKPTDNLDAYDLYLRGKEYWDSDRNVDSTIGMLERAVEVDSAFAKAHSLLAQIYGFSYFNLIDRTDRRLEQCKEAANNAVHYGGDNVDGNMAMGYFYYYGSRDYERALEQFEIVLQRQPNNSDVLAAVGHVQRRQGKWQEAAVNYTKAFEINPHSQTHAFSVLITLSCMRRYEELEHIIDKALYLKPDNAAFLFFKAQAILEREGDTAIVKQILSQAAKYGDPDYVAFMMENYDILYRDYASAAGRRTIPGDFILADSASFYLNKADIYRFWSLDSLSRVYYDSARMVAENRVKIEPDEAFHHTALGSAYAGLGRKFDAVREGTKAVELLPITEDALYGVGMLESLAGIYVATGEYEPAIDQLEYLLSIPSGISVYSLRLHPRWDPLRDHPRFQVLLKKYGAKREK